MHKVIFIPGLDDRTKFLQWAINSYWQDKGLEPVIFVAGWHNGEDSFEQKFQRLIKLIDDFKKDGHTVSLVGISAGGSAVLNAFIKRKNKIHRVINICGRIKVGPLTGFRSFASKTKSSSAFAESVQKSEKGLVTLTSEDKKKLMTIRALFGDELVPSKTTIINGAYNITVPTPEHMLSIGTALTLFSNRIIDFLKN